MTIKTGKTQKAQIWVIGMTCATCAATIEKVLAETHSVTQANVNFASEKASLEYDPGKVDLAKIKNIISESGYGIAVKKSLFPLRGMTCASCVARVEESLKSVPGVVSVAVNLASEKAMVEYLDSVATADLHRAVKEAGCELSEEAETLEDVITAALWETKKLRNYFILAIVLGAIIMTLSFLPGFTGKPYLL